MTKSDALGIAEFALILKFVIAIELLPFTKFEPLIDSVIGTLLFAVLVTTIAFVAVPFSVGFIVGKFKEVGDTVTSINSGT